MRKGGRENCLRREKKKKLEFTDFEGFWEKNDSRKLSDCSQDYQVHFQLLPMLYFILFLRTL